LDGAYFLYSYGRAAKKLVHRIKITGDPRAGVWIRSEIAWLRSARLTNFEPLDASDPDRFDAIVPVPSHHRSSLLNPDSCSASLWAHELAAAYGVPVRRALRRTRTVPKQTSLDRAHRLTASENSLAVRGAALAGCRSVLLADDVMTTGATARACARALKAHGVRRVALAAIAKG
jgi:predicted amidophosphoribosyltransferase